MKQLEVFMIPPSALSAASAENPGKTVGLALLKGDFERLLSGESLEGGLPGGKILPEGGKTLPDGLPTVELVPLAGRKLVGAVAAKAGAGASPVTEEAVLAEGAEHDGEADVPLAANPTEPGAEQLAPADVPAVQPIAAVSISAASADAGEGALSEERLAGSQRMIRLPLRSVGASNERPDDHRRKPGTTAPQAAAAPATAAPVRALARLPIAPVLDPSVTESGKRPADAPLPARVAPGRASEPVAELKLMQPAAAEQDAGAGRSAERRVAASLAGLQLSAGVQTPQPVAEIAPVQAEAPAGRDLAPAAPSQAQAPRPHDLTTLVDRLVEARDNARSANASLSVMHADFGRVSMHFAHDNGNLTVSLTNNDPGFARAVNAAVSPDGGMNNEAQAQADRRADGGHGASTRTSAGEHGSHGERGSQPRGERHDRTAPAANHSHRTTARARSGSRGVFA